LIAKKTGYQNAIKRVFVTVTGTKEFMSLQDYNALIINIGESKDIYIKYRVG